MFRTCPILYYRILARDQILNTQMLCFDFVTTWVQAQVETLANSEQEMVVTYSTLHHAVTNLLGSEEKMSQIIFMSCHLCNKIIIFLRVVMFLGHLLLFTVNDNNIKFLQF